MSAMWETMQSQPAELRRLLDDAGTAENAAERLRGRRLLITGTGTSWHAAAIGALWMRAAGIDAAAAEAAELVLSAPPRPEEALVVVTHRGTKSHTTRLVEDARGRGAPCVVISGTGSPLQADLETVESERSSAHTASYTGALLRLAQLATVLGADLGALNGVPDAVEEALRGPSPEVSAPGRSLEFIGDGLNRWTAAEGALKVRETCYVATEGLSAEQFLHGPSVALDDRDVLVTLDGGGPGSERLLGIADAAQASGIAVHRFSPARIGEPLSVFPLAVTVQRIALDLATQLGTDPDSFGRQRPGREAAWASIPL